MQPGFLKFFYDDILKNKKLVLSAIITTILGFGFTITNFSIGIDDPAAIHYFHTNGSGNMIQQGRLFQVLYDKLTGAEQFIPFFNDFVAAVLFMFSALMFSGLFQYVTDRRFSDIALMIFQCVYISFSMICDKYIFNLDVVVTMASYLLIAYSLAASYEYVYYKKKQSFVAAVLALTIGIGSYEPFLFLYICGVCAIMILKCVVGEEKLKFRDTFREALKFLSVFLTAVFIYYFIVWLVQVLTHQRHEFTRGNLWNSDLSPEEKIRTLIYNFIICFKDFDYLPMVEVDVFMVLGIVLAVYYTVKRKSPTLLLCFIVLYLSTFGIHFVLGKIMYRAGQPFCFMVAFFLLLILYTFRDVRRVNTALTVISFWLIFIQLADMNLAFYHDYARYKKDEFVIHTIATWLVEECDVSKPVVFTNRPPDGYLYSPVDGYGQSNGISMIYWGIATFDELESPIMIENFRMHGYYFLVEPTPEQAKLGNERSKELEAWPSKGCIKEYDDMIVVNFWR